jgi:hypothetical protein
MTQRMLGKHAAKADPRRLMMSSYMSSTLPAPPRSCDRTYGITDWGQMGNDRLGDCAYAAPGHMVMAWSMGTTKKPIIIPDSEIIAAYASGTGYNPVTGANDNGSAMPDVCEQWRSSGIGGNRISAYGALDTRNTVAIKQSIYLFGSAYVGIMLPQTAMQQTEAGLAWTVPYFSEVIGGHAIPLQSYDDDHVWTPTWGKNQCMTWEFLLRYMDEAFACINALWIGADGNAPDSGLNLNALVSDLNVITTPAPMPIAA